MTSHSSQGLTERRVIVNIDTEASRNLVNSRLAYVAVSRAETDARIYTNDATNLGKKLATDISKAQPWTFGWPVAKSFPEHNRRLRPHPRSQNNAPMSSETPTPSRCGRSRLCKQAGKHRRSGPGSSGTTRADTAHPADLYITGRLGAEAREVPVLVQKDQVSPKLAAGYTPGDRIQFARAVQSLRASATTVRPPWLPPIRSETCSPSEQTPRAVRSPTTRTT